MPRLDPVPIRRLAAVLCALGLQACAPAPAPAEPQAVVPQVDAERLLRHFEVLAADSMEGRRVGTAGSARARRYLVAELRRIGVEPVGEGYEHPFRLNGEANGRTGVNLLARIAGTVHPDRHLVLSAHYDHEGIGTPRGGDSIYNGADDNASGVAVLLEAAEYFRRNPPEITIVIAAFDAEEAGLRGAAAFLGSPPVARESIVLNVNLDMVSQSLRGELYAAGTSHYPFLRPLLEPVAARAPVRLLFGHDRPVPGAADDWTGQSDHGRFHAAGIPFLYLGVEDHPLYHTPADEADAVTRDFFVDAARTAIDAVRTLAASPDALARGRGVR